jgi:hypothetical protein
MKKLLLLFFVAVTAFGAEGDRFISNPNQDKDISIQVNDGGVKNDAIKVTGSTSLSTIGKSGETGTHTINGAVTATSSVTSSTLVTAPRINVTGTSVLSIGAADAVSANLYYGAVSSGTNTCSTACSNQDGAVGLDADSGSCLAAWRGDTGAGITCADATSVAKRCLCAGIF